MAANMVNLEEKIRGAARAHGFVMAGFAALHPLDERAAFYRGWLAEGRHGSMGYLERTAERRLNPQRIDPRLRSVVSLAYPYDAPPAAPLDWRSELRGRVAAYAAGPDYHDLVLVRARAVADTITAARQGALARLYVDTGPVLEREWASAAGLGWFGRNTMLLDRRRGSYFVLAEIFTSLEFDAPPAAYRDHCGKCRRCLELCPTGALADGRVLEPRLCISYLTIEHRGAIPVTMRPLLGNWIFGCDICQQVCPFNGGDGPPNEQLEPYLPNLMALDARGFNRRFKSSAIRYAKRRNVLRNAAVALGNSGNRAAVFALARALEFEPEALVRAHAAWALGELGGAPARQALEGALSREPDAAASAEIRGALERL